MSDDLRTSAGTAALSEEISLERIREGVPAEALKALAALHGASDDLAELTLAMLPGGSRSALCVYGLIEEEADETLPTVKLTERGWEAIAALALGRTELPGDLAELGREVGETLVPDDAARERITARASARPTLGREIRRMLGLTDKSVRQQDDSTTEDNRHQASDV